MAETLLLGVAQGILSTLGSQLLKDIRLVWGVKDEFESLQGTVSYIQAVLLDAEEKSTASHQLRSWLTRITEAMDDAENVLDEFSFEALRRKAMYGNNNKVWKEVRVFFSSSNQLVFRCSMVDRIKNLRTRLDGIAADSRNFCLVEHRSERAVVLEERRRQTHSHPPQVVVGREADRDTVVQLLLSEDYKEKVGIVPIVGIGGLGKTYISSSALERLPDSITQLYNLQVMRLKGCRRLIELPNDIHQLINLSQLDLTDCLGLNCMPRGLGKLTSLHTLTKFVVPRDGFILKWAAGLNELHDMNNLRGQLQIGDLRYATTDQVRSSNLKEKEHLQCLTLDWKSAFFSTERVLGEDEMTQALEALEPHRDLKVLIVAGNGGSNFPKWLSCLTNLVDIQIRSCKRCRYIPPLHQLPYLQRLVLFGLEALEYVDSGNATQTTSYFFPSLELLQLRYCQNLKGWWRPSITTLESLPRFPILSQLVIYDCPYLASMPLFPPLKSFKFGGGSVKSLQEILKATVTTEQIGSSLAAASLFSTTLSQLQELNIYKIEDLEFLPEKLLCHMGSLKALAIGVCDNLKAVGPAVRYLTSLETFSLYGCSSLELLEDERDDQVMHWQALGCLKTLSLGWMEFESLPKWLRHLKTIQELNIVFCRNLVSLPTWLVELTSLERLKIKYSGNLSLRCGNNNGEDWPFICHIPNIKVDDTVVKRRGRYLL